MKNNIESQTPDAILVVDFDGLLNFFVECPKDKEHKDLPQDIFINHAKYFEITFKILVDNNVLPVIGSERIVADELHFEDMLTALNTVFGKDRNYLKETYAREIRKKLGNKLLNEAKNPLLNEYVIYDNNNFDRKKITLADDNLIYKAPAEAEDFQFIHVDRKNKQALTDELDFLVEILLRYLPEDKKEKIEEEMEKYTTDPTILNNFKIMIDKFRIYKQTLVHLSEHLDIILTTLEIKKLDLEKHGDKKINKIKIIKNTKKNEDNPFIQLKTELINKLESGHIITASDVKYFRDKLDSITNSALTIPLKKINTTIINEIKEPILDDIRRIFKFGIFSTNGTIDSIKNLNIAFWKKYEVQLNPQTQRKKSIFKFIR